MVERGTVIYSVTALALVFHCAVAVGSRMGIRTGTLTVTRAMLSAGPLNHKKVASHQQS